MLLQVKMFATVDTSEGYYHIELDNVSSFVKTFNTPFSNYRFN